MSDGADETERVTLECALDEAPEKVWRALAIPEFRDHWLTPDADRPVSTEVIEAEPPRRLTLSWREGEAAVGDVVTFTLQPRPEGGTWLRLVHDRAPLPVPVAANTNTMLLRAA